jgi:hypothetical protein
LRNDSDLESADVVIVGDSFIEGLGVESDELISSFLAKDLGRTVANVGQSAYGPQQELELLRQFGTALRPKVCVWAFFEGNDLDDIMRYADAVLDAEARWQELHSFTERSFTKNAVLSLRRLLGLDLGKEWPVELSGQYRTSSGEVVTFYFWYKGRQLTTRDEQALESLASVLREAEDVCGNSGARFLVVFIPTKFRVYEGFMEYEPDSEVVYWVLNNLPIRIEALVRERLPAARFLDLTPALTDEAGRGSLTYLPWDSHWSAEGHRVAALAIGQYLKEWEVNWERK